MCVLVVRFHSSSIGAPTALALLFALTGLCALGTGCGDSQPYTGTVSTGDPSERASDTGMAGHVEGSGTRCTPTTMDGDVLVQTEEDVTARFRVGESYDKTVMLFGGEPVTFENAVSNVYIIGLDKEDALMLAAKHDDFYLCSSPGGQEAQDFILAYDLVPATCEVYDQIVRALAHFDRNNASGGDRVSLRFSGAPLELESVIVDATGEDVTDQLADRNLHLVTEVQQLSGQSVLEFGTN